MNEYKNQIRRYKDLRNQFYNYVTGANYNLSISEKEFQSMLIQLKKSIMIRRWQYKNGTKIYKEEFGDE